MVPGCLVNDRHPKLRIGKELNEITNPTTQLQRFSVFAFFRTPRVNSVAGRTGMTRPFPLPYPGCAGMTRCPITINFSHDPIRLQLGIACAGAAGAWGV
jgi:hypothetical protein